MPTPDETRHPLRCQGPGALFGTIGSVIGGALIVGAVYWFIYRRRVRAVA